MRWFFRNFSPWAAALFLGLGLVALQVLLGGWWYPIFAIPGYFLVGLAGVLGSAGALWSGTPAPKPWCFFAATIFAFYLFLRQAESPDLLMARADTWLLLGGLTVYWTVAWGLRESGPRWVVLFLLFLAMMMQVVLGAAQFVAEYPFHPMSSAAAQLRLPDGKTALANLGLITGSLHARTALSGILEVTTFLALGLLVWGRSAVWVKLLLLWVCMVGFAGMVICLSRSAYLALPVGVLTFALTSFFIVQRGALAHRFLLGLGALMLVALALGLAVATGWESIAVWLRLGEMGVDQYRESLWSLTVPPMLSLDPLWGTGANTFESLARRYRGGGFTADPIHAHSDWLQLLIEYGWIGLGLGLFFFLIHMVSGWRSVLVEAKCSPVQGFLPQSMDLGLSTGSIAALAAIGAHVVFDYSLHLPAVAMLVAMCAGWLVSSGGGENAPTAPMPIWVRPFALLGAAAGLFLGVWVWREAPAERSVLAAENALVPLDASRVEALAEDGLRSRPGHPRLRWLVGIAAREQAATALQTDARAALDYSEQAVRHLRWAAAARPRDVFVKSDFARALDFSAFLKLQLAELTADPFRARSLRAEAESDFVAATAAHLRCIGGDPDHARGYEGLGRHFLLRGENSAARRLYQLAATLPGARESGAALQYLDQNTDTR